MSFTFLFALLALVLLLHARVLLPGSKLREIGGGGGSGEPPPVDAALAGLFSSSAKNTRIAEQEYPDSPLERLVVLATGDLIPYMRDDLLRRRRRGESFFERHLHGWLTLMNWTPNPQRKKRRNG